MFFRPETVPLPPHSTSLDAVPTEASLNTDQRTSEPQHLPAPHEHQPLDTVGAICVDHKGHIVSGVSSGGIALKQPGRLGQVS